MVTDSAVLGLCLAYSACLAGFFGALAYRRAEIIEYATALWSAAVLAVGVCCLSPALIWLGVHVGLPRRLCLSAPIVLFPMAGVAAVWARGRAKARELIVHRGTRISRSADQRVGRVVATTEMDLAGVFVPPLDECKHFKLIGTTGTGKSTAISALLHAALARGDRVVCADPDGGYAAKYYRPERGDRLLNPFDASAPRWDLYAELVRPYDYDQLALSLIPEAPLTQDTWNRYARVLLAAVLRQTHGSGRESVPELVRLISYAPLEELRILLAGTSAQPFLEEGNERMFASLRSVTVAAIAPLTHVQAQRAELLSIRGWIQTGSGALFLTYHADQIASLKTLIATWLRLAIFEAMSGKYINQRIWFVIDELDALGKINGLKDALARVRKFGGRCVLGFQSIAQVSGTYGDAEAQTIVENCGNTLILRCSASERGGTAQFASKLIGERQVSRDTVSHSRPKRMSLMGGRGEQGRETVTRATSLTTEPAVMAAEIEQLPDLHGYLKLASRSDWLRVQVTQP